jgi:hypothetical protein
MIAIPFSQKTTFDKDGKCQDRGADRNYRAFESKRHAIDFIKKACPGMRPSNAFSILGRLLTVEYS